MPTFTPRAPFSASAIFAFALAACAGPPVAPKAPAGVTAVSLTVTSRSIPSGGSIPVDETCDGKNASPALEWSAPPQGTKALAIVVDDLNSTPNEFTHWILYDLPPTLTKLPEAFEPPADQPDGGTVGLNDFQHVQYDGPCPPHNSIHRYRFHVLALDAPTGLGSGADREKVDRAMNGHVLGEGTLEAKLSR